jgi:hypothetical protein
MSVERTEREKATLAAMRRERAIPAGRRRARFSLFLCVAFGTYPALAAEPRDPAAAEALFNAGKTLMDRGDYQKACPKLEESYRLDRATGALYALALCHEKQGRLATAWAEFTDAAALANAERYAEREQSARKHAEALLPRLSFLVVRVKAQTARLPGLAISRDGVALGPAAWGIPMPVDPGSHSLRAEAPGYEPWQKIITIGAKPHSEILEVPELVPLSAARPSGPARGRTGGTPESQSVSPVRLTGVALMGAGAAGLGIAAFASWRALDKKSDSNRTCDGNICPAEGERDRWLASEAALWATAGAIAGGVTLGTGIVLYVTGAPAEKRVAVSVSPRGVAMQASF